MAGLVVVRGAGYRGVWLCEFEDTPQNIYASRGRPQDRAQTMEGVKYNETTRDSDEEHVNRFSGLGWSGVGQGEAFPSSKLFRFWIFNPNCCGRPSVS